MSGRKQFDEAGALDAAMRVFWLKGYSGTSMSDLEAATGLNKSSIYNSFKNKETLYGLCLERFRVEYTRNALALLDEADFDIAIRRFFDALIAGFDNPNCPSGCIASMAALEMGGREDFLGEIISKGLHEMLESLELRLKRAQEERQLSADRNCQSLAAMILAVTRGVIVLNMGTGSAKSGRLAYEELMALLTMKRQ